MMFPPNPPLLKIFTVSLEATFQSPNLELKYSESTCLSIARYLANHSRRQQNAIGMGQFLSARSEFHDIPFLEELFFFCKFAGC